MVSKESRTKIREKKHRRQRNRFSGTAERPRLAVFQEQQCHKRRKEKDSQSYPFFL